jgi:ubiquinone/menaquinone biosynthesis C-methylase UbiE
LNNHPGDLPDNSFSHVICEDILEHVDDTLRFLEEVHRIAESNAEVYIRTPHFTNHNAWVDPTHRRPFSVFTFRDYITSAGDYAYYTNAKFELINLRIGFISIKKMPWNLIGRYIAKNLPNSMKRLCLVRYFPHRVWK